MDLGSKGCPIVSECRNVAQGIAQGDYKNAALNGGLLSLYAVAGGVQTGGNAKISMGSA